MAAKQLSSLSMLTRDIQRLALAVAMTILLFYSISVYIGREKLYHDWISYAASDSDAINLPNDTPEPIQNIPIPLPGPNVAPNDDSSGDKIAAQPLSPQDEATAKTEGDATDALQDVVVNS